MLIRQDRNRDRFRTAKGNPGAGRFAPRRAAFAQAMTTAAQTIARDHHPIHGVSAAALKAAADARALHGAPSIAPRKTTAAQRRAARNAELFGLVGRGGAR